MNIPDDAPIDSYELVITDPPQWRREQPQLVWVRWATDLADAGAPPFCGTIIVPVVSGNTAPGSMLTLPFTVSGRTYEQIYIDTHDDAGHVWDGTLTARGVQLSPSPVLLGTAARATRQHRTNLRQLGDWYATVGQDVGVLTAAQCLARDISTTLYRVAESIRSLTNDKE